MIIEVDIYSQIRTIYEEGETQRSITKRLGITRQTVKKYCDGSTPPQVRKSYTRALSVITDDDKNFIVSYLMLDQEQKLPKQQHNAKRIYDRLVSQSGSSASYSTVREAVKLLRSERVSSPG